MIPQLCFYLYRTLTVNSRWVEYIHPKINVRIFNTFLSFESEFKFKMSCKTVNLLRWLLFRNGIKVRKIVFSFWNQAAIITKFCITYCAISAQLDTNVKLGAKWGVPEGYTGVHELTG